MRRNKMVDPLMSEGAYRGSSFDSSRQGPDLTLPHRSFFVKAVTGFEKICRAAPMIKPKVASDE